MEIDESSTIAYLIMRLLDKEDGAIFICQSKDFPNNLTLTYRGSNREDSEYQIHVQKVKQSK